MSVNFRVLFIAMLMFLHSVFSHVHFVYADTVNDLQTSIASINKQLDAVNKEINDYNKKISQTKGEATTLKAALARLESQRTALLKQINYTTLQIQKTNKNIAITQNNIASTTKSIDLGEGSIAELLRSIAQEEDKPPLFVEMISHKETLSEIFDKVAKNDDVRNAVAIRVHTLQSDKSDLEAVKAQYEVSHKQLQDLQGTLLSQKTVVEATSKEKNSLLDQTKNKESEYQKLLADRRAKKNALEAEVADFETKLKTAVDTAKLPHVGSGVLSWPLKSVIITQYFGNTAFASANPQVYTAGTHNGIDMGTPVGTPVYSAQSGTVVDTGDTDIACRGASYGRWILIKHNNGLSTLYGHLSKIDVVKGQALSLGDRIGLSGTTGYSTGPHLHFTVYASDAVHVLGPTEYVSHACGTYMVFPVSPKGGYLNPLSYL